MEINCTTYHNLWTPFLRLQNRCRPCLHLALKYGNILANRTGYTAHNKSTIGNHELILACLRKTRDILNQYTDTQANNRTSSKCSLGSKKCHPFTHNYRQLRYENYFYLVTTGGQRTYVRTPNNPYSTMKTVAARSSETSVLIYQPCDVASNRTDIHDLKFME
jgi:hypothetical protein